MTKNYEKPDSLNVDLRKEQMKSLHYSCMIKLKANPRVIISNHTFPAETGEVIGFYTTNRE